MVEKSVVANHLVTVSCYVVPDPPPSIVWLKVQYLMILSVFKLIMSGNIWLIKLLKKIIVLID